VRDDTLGSQVVQQRRNARGRQAPPILDVRGEERHHRIGVKLIDVDVLAFHPAAQMRQHGERARDAQRRVPLLQQADAAPSNWPPAASAHMNTRPPAPLGSFAPQTAGAS
jgi:hypothetical protein